MVSGQQLVLSSNEQERLLKETRHLIRVKRLQKIREKEKELAAERLRNYQNCSNSLWKNAVNLLKSQWESSRQETAGNLRNKFNDQQKEYGKAHQQALVQSQKDVEFTKDFKEEIESSATEEKKRFMAALEEEHRSQLTTEYEQKKKIEILKTTRHNEDSRSTKLISLYRKATERLVPPKEIPSLSTAHLPNRPTSYQNTSHHREFSAIRTRKSREYNAVVDAKVWESIEKTQQNNKEEKTRQFEEAAQNRYEKAKCAFELEKEKKRITGQLEHLKKLDRKRQVDRIHPNTYCFRVEKKNELLAQAFEKRFMEK